MAAIRLYAFRDCASAAHTQQTRCINPMLAPMLGQRRRPTLGECLVFAAHRQTTATAYLQCEQLLQLDCTLWNSDRSNSVIIDKL